MRHGQSAVALVFGIHNQTNSRNVINLVDSFLLPLHFAIDAIEMLRATANILALDAKFTHARLQRFANLLKPRFSIGSLFYNQAL